MSPGSVCISIGSAKSLHGFEVGCASVSISELGTAQTVVGNSPASFPTSALNDFGLFSLNPTEQTWLVLPQINRVGQYRSALHPNDLLMHECAELIPDRFEHHLAA